MTSRMVRSLGYIGLASNKCDEWQTFGREMLGVDVDTDEAGVVSFRMDEKAHRYLIEPASVAELRFLGFDVGCGADLHRLHAHLQNLNLDIQTATPAELKSRQVDDLFWVKDPDGVRIDFFTGLKDVSAPMKPGKPIGGFVTGDLGMGHIVRYTPNYLEMSAFYQDVLGFSLSDFHHQPFAIEFLRTNRRHHSIGLIDDKGIPRIHHSMVEYQYWDDVGRAYDLALEKPEKIAVTLGRHLNDHITSFYVWTPDDFFIEIGWAGRTVDDASWEVQEIAAPSLWGHVRNWQTEQKRIQTRAMIAAIGEKGIRAPVAVSGEGPFSIPPVLTNTQVKA